MEPDEVCPAPMAVRGTVTLPTVSTVHLMAAPWPPKFLISSWVGVVRE